MIACFIIQLYYPHSGKIVIFNFNAVMSTTSSEEGCEIGPTISPGRFQIRLRKALQNMQQDDIQTREKSVCTYRKHDKLLSDYQIHVTDSRTKKKDSKSTKPKDSKSANEDKMFGVSRDVYHTHTVISAACYC